MNHNAPLFITQGYTNIHHSPARFQLHVPGQQGMPLPDLIDMNHISLVPCCVKQDVLVSGYSRLSCKELNLLRFASDINGVIYIFFHEDHDGIRPLTPTPASYVRRK